MKKIILAMAFVLCLLFSTAYASDVYIDGKKVAFTKDSGYPFAENGRTLVPLRITMESFGAEVEWEASTNTAIVRKDAVTVRCVIGEKSIYRNNVQIPNDAAAVVKSGRTYLPIRAVLEAFGAKVEWDGSVKVESSGELSFIESVEKSPSVTTNYWSTWEKALAAKKSGDYQKAIDGIRSISSEFIRTNKSASNAMLYSHLGDCYAKLGNYSRAKACYEKEAEYWELTAGMEESVIAALRKARLIKTNAQIYIATTNPDYDAKDYFGEVHEPRNSVYLGAYAEGDKAIHNPYDSSKFYMDTYPGLIGTDVKGYIVYLPYGEFVSEYDSHIRRAREKNKILQVALEPHEGMKQVKASDSYIKELAKEMENYDCQFMLRFAGEMNDGTSSWFTTPAEYIEKFRIVADVFHKYAPSVPIIWSPNFYPAETIADYYPGDEYVDYVGMSSYMCHQPITDPLEEGIDRGRWSTQPDTLYSLYSHKKPIVISESGSSYLDKQYGAGDVTEYASRQIKDFYTYLPIRYPNIKMAFLFNSNNSEIRRFTLSGNSEYLEAYKEGISSDIYSINDDQQHETYYELGNNVRVEAKSTALYAHITTPENDVAYVNYYIDGVKLGTAYDIPYEVDVNFSSYKGKKTEVRVKAYNSKGTKVADYAVNVEVK